MTTTLREAVEKLRNRWEMLASDPEVHVRSRDDYAERAEELTAILAAHPDAPEPRVRIGDPLCPECAKPLQRVVKSPDSMLNDDQFDACRAGDWFCDSCKGNGRGFTGFRYYWNRELVALPPPASRRDETPKTSNGMELRERARALVASSPLHKRFIAHTPLENDIAVWIEDFASAVLEGRTSMFEPKGEA